MNLRLRYNTLSIIYFALCMVVLIFFMCIDMQGQEHASDGIKGARTMICLSAMVLIGSLIKLFVIPNYKAYSPTLVMILYILYMTWVFIPIFSNDIHGDSMEAIVVGVKHIIPFFALLLPFNFMLNHSDSKLFGWFFCLASLAFAASYFKVLLDYIATFQVPPPMIITYYTLYILPLILLTCGNKRRVFFIFFTAIILIASIKRGGILAMGCGLITYGFIYVIVSKKFSWKYFIGTLLLILSLISILIIMGDTDENNLLQRFSEMEDDGGSERTIVWEMTFNLISNSDITSLLLGHGYNAVALHSTAGVSAHNDFLEITYDYGLIGGILYLSAFISLIWTTYLNIVRKTIYAAPLSMFVTIYLFLSLMSHVAIYSWFNIIMLTIGYISARERLDARNK